MRGTAQHFRRVGNVCVSVCVCACGCQSVCTPVALRLFSDVMTCAVFNAESMLTARSGLDLGVGLPVGA